MCLQIADGNFHVIIPYDEENLPKVRAMEDQLIDRVLACGGTVSGEHGIGLGRIRHVKKEHGDVYMDLMRRIKQAVDPHCIMNPGKIFEVQPTFRNSSNPANL